MDNLPVNPSRTPRLGFPIESRPLPNGGDDEAVRLPPEISTAPKPARPETAPAAEPAGPPPAEISALTEADFAGDMPRTGMLGNAYVPFQKPGRKYARGEGLSKGTLFPGLDLPFKNYTANREVANTPLGELMAVGFAINELGLYLDTHPEDGEALQQRNSYARMYKDAMQTYEQQNGPLSQNAVMDSKYGWLKSPWPWEAK